MIYFLIYQILVDTKFINYRVTIKLAYYISNTF